MPLCASITQKMERNNFYMHIYVEVICMLDTYTHMRQSWKRTNETNRNEHDWMLCGEVSEKMRICCLLWSGQVQVSTGHLWAWGTGLGRWEAGDAWLVSFDYFVDIGAFWFSVLVQSTVERSEFCTKVSVF